MLLKEKLHPLYPLMVQLTDQDIKEFQVLWKKETGQDITPQVAAEYAGDLLGLVQLVYDTHPSRKHLPDSIT